MPGEKLTKRIVWAIFGKPQRKVLHEQAVRDGVPFSETKFWPAGLNMMKDLLPSGKRLHVSGGMVCPELYSADVGDVVPTIAPFSISSPAQVTLNKVFE